MIRRSIENGLAHRAVFVYGVLYFGAMIYLCVIRPLEYVAHVVAS
jgi:hypothetical protein